MAVIKEKNISNAQIKRLWAISKNLGMIKDDVYAFCGVDSLHDLTERELNIKLSQLSKMQIYDKPKKSNKEYNTVAGMVTVGQQKKIWALMYELKKKDIEDSFSSLGKRLAGIIIREFKINATEKEPLIWLDYKSANKLIETIKKYIENVKGG